MPPKRRGNMRKGPIRTTNQQKANKRNTNAARKTTSLGSGSAYAETRGTKTPSDGSCTPKRNRHISDMTETVEEAARLLDHCHWGGSADHYLEHLYMVSYYDYLVIFRNQKTRIPPGSQMSPRARSRHNAHQTERGQGPTQVQSIA